jgi:Putative Actinobacterial Holin-X, holin superfamily III
MLRPLRLARIAAEAEGLRLRYMAQRTATRAILGAIALVFLLGALAFFHAAFWFWLRRHFESPATSLIVAGADLLVALLFGLVASRSSPGRLEREALDVRRRALENATSTLAYSTLAAQTLRLGANVFRRRRS